MPSAPPDLASGGVASSRVSSPRPSLALLRAVADRNGYPIETFREDGIQGVIFSDVFDLEEDFLGSYWAFRGASGAEAAAILRFWLRQETRKTKTLEFGYSLACSLGRLLAEKGRLVEDLLDPVLRQTDWTSCDAPQFLLAGLAAFPDGPERAAELLDIVPEDARHGLFLACWHLPALPVQRKLLAKCLEWIADPAWHGYPDEAYWLRCFLCKWLVQDTFSLRRLAPLVQWNARRDFTLLTR